MAFNANVHNSIGATLSVYIGTPATDDVAGFTAITGWIEVGELTEFGNPSISIAQDTHTPLKTGFEENRYGIKSADGADYVCGRDVTDAGQQAIQSAVEDREELSIKISDTSGDEYYWGTISSFTPSDRSDGVISFGFTFQPNCEQVLDAA
jgi:hypothetical protein